MPSVFDRLRTALAPGVDLEREHASGGMGDVFVGRDTVLDRPIAVKVLKQELATAIAAERFLLEARSAARLSHPNVVKVYDSDIADGLLYFTMELIAGETLESRLKQGPLSEADTTALGRDVLAALGAAHRLGIVHRDVKPSNIFLDGGRTKLGDFGIARVLESDTPTLTAPGRPIGTPYYMSPEQSRGEQVGPQSDLYSTGLVLYEACTARRWIPGTAPDRGEWSDVPAELRPSLRKALQVEPGERWQDAESFAAALPGHRTPWRPVVVAALVAAAMIYLIAYQAVPAARRWWWRHTARYDLVLFPFETKGAPDPALESSIYSATVWYFQQLPNLNLVPPGSAAREWSGSALPQTERLARLTKPMHAHFGAWAAVSRVGARLEVDLRVRNDRGEPILQTLIRGDSAENQLVIADSIGAHILGAISEKLPPTYRRGADLVKVSREAALEFLQGEAAAERDAWLPAEEHYANALRLDSTFILAAWRLGNARRWMPLRPTPPFPPGFRALFQARRNDLPEVDRLLVDAQFAPSGLARLAAYEAARHLAPDDPYVMLLYGDELFHRGPLSGRSLAEAARMLAGATAGDSTLAPAWEHLAWALIRLGRREEAERALTNLDRVAGQPEESEIYLPAFLRVAYTARFDPANLGSAGSRLMESDSNLAIAARGALAFDLPEVELEFGSMLAAREDAPPALHASGLVAQGVALMALGRPSAALVTLDSATALFSDPAEARLQAAEWRVIPEALGVPGIIEAEAERGRAVLASLAARPGGVRAAWALAVDALARRDTAARWDTMAGHWRSIVAQDDSVGGSLGALLAAMAAARGGSPESALLISEPALARDSAGYAPDPFLRAALHLLRGKWQVEAGRPDEADRSWLWYENTDAVGWPNAEAQPAEVDWALGSWARVQRASLASAADRQGDACALGRRVLEIWSSAETPIARVADSLRTSLAGCRR
jgi:tRNA A-37 threonylcarbamoyl transferase component Bud32/tetratricopeptide (TPR) repeat protein